MKKAFREALKAYKRHFWKFFIIDFVFLLFAAVFYLYARIRIELYIAALNRYYEQLPMLQSMVQDGSAEAIMQLNSYLEAVTPLLDRITLFMFFIVPAGMFLLWCFFQHMHYSLISSNKWLNLRKLLAFAAITLPFYVVMLLLADKAVEGSVQFFAGQVSIGAMAAYAVIGVLLAYVLHVAYGLCMHFGLREVVNKALIALVKKFHKLFPAVLAYLVLFAVVVASLMEAALKAIAENYWEMAAAIAVLVAAILALGFARAFFAVLAKRVA